MSFQFETQEALKSLGVCDVPQEWINAIWDQNFCESVSPPLEVDHSVLLNDSGWSRVVKAGRRWLETAQQETSLDHRDDDDEITGNRAPGFWTTLLDAGVSHKLLMALLYCLMERTKHRAMDKLCAIHAAQFYLVLLQLPGSGAYKMFHPMIFQKMLDVFYLLPNKDPAQRKQSTTSIDNEPLHKGGRGKRKRPRPQYSDDNDDDLETGFHDDQADTLDSTTEEKVKFHVKQLIKDVHSYLKVHSLSEYEATRYQLIQVMLRMARVDVSSRTELETALSFRSNVEAPMCVFAWQCLDVLCHEKQGNIDKIVLEIISILKQIVSASKQVFHQLLSGVLMLGVDGGVTTSTPLPSHLTTFSQHCLTFVCHIVNRHGDSVLTPLKALTQHICTKVPDRAEYRGRMASIVSRLLELFSDQHYSELLDWIYKFSRNTKIAYRVFALDVVSELVSKPLRQPQQGSLMAEVECRLSYKFLLKMILSRCSDKAPSVRGRALSSLAMVAGSSDSELVEAVKRSVNSYTATDPLVAMPTKPSDNVIVQMVRRRTSDEKVGVRKAAIQALEGLVKLDKNTTLKEDVVILHERCLDPALSVRKQALISLTTLMLERPDCTILHQYWLDGVLPMVMDREGGAQEKCLQLLEDVILKNITTLKKSTSEMHHFAWHLLSLISSEDHQDLSRYLCRVLDHWAQSGKLTSSLVNAVCSHTTSKEHLKPAWMLLSEISQYTTSIEAKFVCDNWRLHSSGVTMETTMPLVQIVVAIGNLAQSLSKIAIQDIKEEMVELLQSFVLNPAVIQVAINTLCQICSALNKNPSDYQKAVDAWCLPLLKTCEEYISGVMKDRDSGSDSSWLGEKEAATYFFTLGEVAQLCPAHTSHHLCLMVQSILLATSESTDVATPTSPSSVISQSSHLSGLSDLCLSPTLRAHIYITLGKLCLQNEELAKRSVVHMVKELETSKSSAIRNNIIVILCDLAVRYSTKVDPYIPNISACLRDESLLVRKQTLTLLARLLQEDYVKWRGSLFFRFMSSLVDDELKRFGEFCLVHLLLSRHPTVFYTHFVECVFHFNCYEKHKVYNRFKQSDREKQLFSLKGAKNSDKRMIIYNFLLSHMADEHRFQLSAKLCQEVLGAIVDGLIPLDDDSVGVVKDTLAVLKSKEIKLSSLRRNVGEELAEEGDQVGAAVATAQAKIISQIVKKNVIENIVPIVVSTKHYFEQHHSPLLKDLLLYLKELMQDYRSEVSDILTTDKQLAEEIEFDLRRLEEEQKRAAKSVQTPLAITPHAQLISPLISSPVVLGGPRSASTVVATPPKLKTPACGGTTKQMKTPIPALKLKTPHRIKLGMTPLVVVQKIPSPERFNKSSRGTKPLSQTPLASNDTVTTASVGGDVKEDELKKENVSSPVAARARASSINTDYNTTIKTPVMVGRTVARLSLQRAVLLSTAKKAGQFKMQTPVNEKTFGVATGDETLHPGRAASTPEGLAESISFNVSSLVPPSPIPPNTSLKCYTSRQDNKPSSNQPSRRTTRNKTRGSSTVAGVSRQTRNTDGKPGKKRAKKVEIDASNVEDDKKTDADIVMLPPTTEPRRLDKWRVKVN